jgi:hypothetical protein
MVGTKADAAWARKPFRGRPNAGASTTYPTWRMCLPTAHEGAARRNDLRTRFKGLLR